MLGCIKLAINNIAEKCQRLHSSPVENLDFDVKLKLIQVIIILLFYNFNFSSTVLAVAHRVDVKL